MRLIGAIVLGLLMITSCVPAKKYNELLEKEKQCSEELEKYKSDALTYESEYTNIKAQYDLLSSQASTLKEDTASLGHQYRTLRAKYDKIALINETLENNYDKLRLSGAKDAAVLQADLQAKQLELQKKEDALLALEKELVAKEHLLIEREMRLKELSEIIKQKDNAVKQLKERVAEALKGFENKGLKVEERDGKIYVSMEARLLFASGSIAVEQEGKKALVDLAKVLESEKDLEIFVEGHTDTDKMAGTNHPKNNWELSVLRATSVIEIMLDNSSMDPTRLIASGRSEFIPVDPEDKAKNRRIEIIIAPDLNELYKMISE